MVQLQLLLVPPPAKVAVIIITQGHLACVTKERKTKETNKKPSLLMSVMPLAHFGLMFLVFLFGLNFYPLFSWDFIYFLLRCRQSLRK